jgi:hypothetical protein
MKTNFIFFSSLFFVLTAVSFAEAIDLSQISPGDAYIQYSAPSGPVETCVIPRHFPGGNYSDDDVSDEVKLCRMMTPSHFQRNVQFASHPTRSLPQEELSRPSETVALCPKLNSTNPGTLFVKIEKGMTADQARQKFCPPHSSAKSLIGEASVEAKFKQSTSCSDTSAALAAYHLSRLFGGIGRAPVAVLRTMSKDTHFDISKSATAILGSSSGAIGQTWATLLGLHSGNPSSPQVQRVFSTDMQLVVGALSKNVKREYKYTVLNRASSYDTRYVDFKGSIGWKRVTSSGSVAEMAQAPRNEFEKLAPAIVQAKDVSDMILLDVLLNQQDRIGNIHFKLAWYKRTADGFQREGLKKERIEGLDEQEEIEKILRKTPNLASEDELHRAGAQLAGRLFPGQQVTLVREMILKDNDCGVTKSNMMRKENYLESLRRMSPETYSRFIAFAKKVIQSETQDYKSIKAYFEKDLLLSSASFDGRSAGTYSFRDNVIFAYSTLTSACKAGRLQLDLDLRGQLTGRWPQVSCE